MRQIKRNYFSLSEPERTVNNRFRADVSGKSDTPLEKHIAKTRLQSLNVLSCIDRHRLLFHFAESAQIIETEDMVGMRMRINDRVDGG